MQTEELVITNLLSNDDYYRKVIPFLKPEYFSGCYAIMLEKILEYSNKYNTQPTNKAMSIMVEDSINIHEDDEAMINSFLSQTFTPEKDLEWLLDQTEDYCKQKAIFNAIKQGIHIIDGKDKTYTPEALPDILSEALKVGFDNHIGHDYMNDVEERYDYYHKVEERIPFDIDMLNTITKGGLPPKTLNVALAPTGVGKTLFMTHMASHCLSTGLDVLYITLEMAEERIAERVDANLLNIPIANLIDYSKNQYVDKFSELRNKTQGRLIIKEYPTASAHAGHFKALLDELKLKRDFVPKIVFIDYLNICVSSRYRAGSGANSYTIIKSVAEELRGLAVERNLPIVTATQTNREGFNSSDIEMDNTSESFGLPMTADFFFAMISTEELAQLGQIMIKQLKNRYTDVNKNIRFMVGVDRSRMKLMNLESAEEQQTPSSTQEDNMFDTSSTSRQFDDSEFKF